MKITLRKAMDELMMGRRAQIAAEFLIILAVAMVLFLFLLGIVGQKSSELDTRRTQLYAQQQADQIALELTALRQAGRGASATITLPETLSDGALYIIDVHPQQRLVNLIWSSQGAARQYASTLAGGAIAGNLTQLNDDIYVANNGTHLIITAQQTSFTCQQHCAQEGYITGACRIGAVQCSENAEIHSSDGDAYCIKTNTGVCCCS